MAIKFGGEFEVQRSPEEVFDFLTDPNRFAPLLPEFQGVSVHDAQNFTVKVNVGVSYIKGVADVKLQLAESLRPQRAQYKGQGSVAGGNVNMIAGFDLAPLGTGTKIAWQGEAQVFGRLTSVAGALEDLALAAKLHKRAELEALKYRNFQSDLAAKLLTVSSIALRPLPTNMASD